MPPSALYSPKLCLIFSTDKFLEPFSIYRKIAKMVQEFPYFHTQFTPVINILDQHGTFVISMNQREYVIN